MPNIPGKYCQPFPGNAANHSKDILPTESAATVTLSKKCCQQFPGNAA